MSAVRNLATQRVSLNRDLTVVCGKNAQGKSSLLEAVYLLATTRSFRTSNPREAIHHDEQTLQIVGQISDPKSRENSLDSARELSFSLPRGRGIRRLTVGEYATKLSDYLELLPALYLSGRSVQLAAGSPAERRRYMDRATAAASGDHVSDLGEYRKALAQRNQLLRDNAPDQQLDPWEEILARSGDKLVARRRQQIALWQQEIGSWPDLYPEGDATQLRYERGRLMSSTESLLEGLRQARPRDRQIGSTSVGPHRDDLMIEIGDRSLWKYGSAGQLRSALAALNLAQARAVARTRDDGGQPLLILDDVDTDLDPDRLVGLLNSARNEGQVLAASTKTQPLEQIDAQRLDVREGFIDTRELNDSQLKSREEDGRN